MVGKATSDWGGSRKPLIEWALGLRLNIKRTRKAQSDSHNSGVKIWSLCSVSSTLSHANPWTTLSNPCNKVRGKNIVKEVFLRPSFLRPLFLRLLSLRRYVSSIYMYILHGSADDYITLQLYIHTCRIHIDAMNKDFFKKIIPLTLFEGLCVWEGVGDRTELQYIDPNSYGHQRCLSRSPGLLNQRPKGPALRWMLAPSTASCL